MMYKYKYLQKTGKDRTGGDTKDIPENELLSKCNIQIGKCYDSKGDEVSGAIWKSFDEGSCNFYIVPETREFDRGKAIEIGRKIKAMLDDMLEKKLLNDFKMPRNYLSQGSQDCTKEHKYIYVTFKNYEYLLGFQSLICSNATPKEINCYLDRIQFMRYSKGKNGPNYKIEKDNLMVLYPENEGNESQKAGPEGCIVKNEASGMIVDSIPTL